MLTFGRRVAVLRKGKKMSQTELAEQIDSSVSVISRYELDKMTPSIESAKKIAEVLETTVGYLLGEDKGEILFENPELLRRFEDIAGFEKEDKEHILYTLDALIKSVKIRNI